MSPSIYFVRFEHTRIFYVDWSLQKPKIHFARWSDLDPAQETFEMRRQELYYGKDEEDDERPMWDREIEEPTPELRLACKLC